MLWAFFAYSQSFFEGDIVYKVEVEIKDKSHPWADYLANKWGDTMIVSHNTDGFQKRIYKNSKPNGFFWHIYNAETNEYFATWHNLDTIYYYNCAESITNLVELKKEKSEIVLNKICPSFSIEFKDISSHEMITTTIYYDPDLPINFLAYRNFRDTHIDEIYKHSHSHLVKWSIDMELVHVTFTAIQVIEKKLPTDHFLIPYGFPMKKS